MDGIEPTIELRQVTTADVVRTAQWLQDDAVASLWFGRDATGQALHLGYLPQDMMKATPDQFRRVFTDEHRRIRAAYAPEHGHIGEAQLVDEEAIGNVELAVLIGRRDIWGQGYGRAVLRALLREVFEVLARARAWVDVREDNYRALRMCEAVGFQYEGRLRGSRPRQDGGRVDSIVMGMLAEDYFRLLEREEKDLLLSASLT